MASFFFKFAAPITRKSPNASDIRHISSRPTTKWGINSPNVFPVKRKIPVFFSLSWANKVSTRVSHHYCCGWLMLVRSAVVTCAFFVVTLVMLAATPWVRIYLDSCREAEDLWILSFRSTIESMDWFRDIPRLPLHTQNSTVKKML